jgi:hypothetical protein
MTTPRGAQTPDPFRDASDLQDRVHALEQKMLSGGMVKIADFVSNNTKLTSSVSNISQAFSHLRVFFVGQSTRPSFPNTGYRFTFSTPAGVITSVYHFNYWGYGNGAGGVIQGQVANDTRGYLGQTPAGTRTNDTCVSHGVIDIPYYTLRNTIKSFLVNTTLHDGNTLFQGLVINNVNTGTSDAVTGLSLSDDSASPLGPNIQAALYGVL